MTQAPAAMSGKWVTRCIDDICDAGTVLINEYPLVLEELQRVKPGSYFSHSPAGGLGWATGAALGSILPGWVHVPILLYDPVGRDTWDGSLSCLAPRGHLACFGNSSGQVPPFSVNELRDRGSLSVSWVRFSDYTADPAELEAAARELFDAIAGGALRPGAPRCLPLDQAAEAHRLLESGATTGTLVLVP
jgi:NADPH2:quinone reductase